MSACNFTQPILGTECLGDSLYNKINPNFENLDNAVCTLSTNLLNVVNTPTVDLVFNSGTRTLSANVNTYFSYRNKIINGDMRIDQRNNGAAVTVANTNNIFSFAPDRFFSFYVNNNPMTVITQRQSGATGGTANPEHHYYMRTFVSQGNNYTNAVGTQEQFNIQQRIEGFNIAELKWGPAEAKTVTVSFWVRSNYTGTYAFVFSSSSAATAGFPSQARVYATTYVISVANTWEKKTITVPGDTTPSSDKWFFDNNIGVNVAWNLGISDYTFTAGGAGLNTWHTQTGGLNSSIQATLQTLHNKTGAYFDLTGVQFEVGTVATAFEHRSIGNELNLCQRYYEQCEIYDSRDGFLGEGANFYTNELWVDFKVPKRTNPTVVITYANGENQFNVANPGKSANSSSGVAWFFFSFSTINGALFSWRPIASGIDTAPYCRFNASSEM